MLRTCDTCGERFHARRSHARFCCGACRQAEYRVRRGDQHTSKRHRARLYQTGSVGLNPTEAEQAAIDAADQILGAALRGDPAAGSAAAHIADYARRVNATITRMQAPLKHGSATPTESHTTSPINFT